MRYPDFNFLINWYIHGSWAFPITPPPSASTIKRQLIADAMAYWESRGRPKETINEKLYAGLLYGWQAEHPPASNYANVILADNPFGYWRLDDVTGSVAANLGSGSGPGSYTSGGGLADVANWAPRTPAAVASGLAVTLITTPPALAASFVEIPPGLFGALDFTNEMWFRWSVPVVSSGLLVNAAAPGQINLQIYFNPDSTLTAHRWPPGGGIVTIHAPATTQDVWHHVVYRRITGVSVSLWVDGVQAATTADPAGMGPATAPVSVGGDPTGTNFTDGMIDEVAIYQHALTGPQIAAHYAARA